MKEEEDDHRGHVSEKKTTDGIIFRGGGVIFWPEEAEIKTPGWVLSIPREVCLHMFTRQIERERGREDADERTGGEQSERRRRPGGV